MPCIGPSVSIVDANSLYTSANSKLDGSYIALSQEEPLA
jgi:hypothetical protein